MLDYFAVHLTIYPETTFLWITKDDSTSILSTAKNKGVDHKVVIHSSERKDLPQLLSFCDASIFFIKPLFSKKASSPTKMAELLGMGIPLICNNGVGDTDGVVRKEKVGLVVNDFSDNDYLNVAKQFNSLLSYDKEHLRNVAQEHFSLEEGVVSYAKVYSSLLSENS